MSQFKALLEKQKKEKEETEQKEKEKANENAVKNEQQLPNTQPEEEVYEEPIYEEGNTSYDQDDHRPSDRGNRYYTQPNTTTEKQSIFSGKIYRVVNVELLNISGKDIVVGVTDLEIGLTVL